MVSVAAPTPISIRLTRTFLAPITAPAAVSVAVADSIVTAGVLVARLVAAGLHELVLGYDIVEECLNGVAGAGGHGGVGRFLRVDEWYRSRDVCSHGEVRSECAEL